MEYRFLGSSGLKVSALSFGAWVTFGDQIDEDMASECMRVAYDAGVNFFDNAEVYAGGRAETMMGNIIQRTGWQRSDLILSTKIFWGGDGPNDRGLSRKHIIEGTTAALERLQVDYVDLVFCHRPDLYTPIAETVRAMAHIVDRGLAFYWGTSEWSSEQIRSAHDIAQREHLPPPTMEQPQYNMFHRDRVEKEYLPLYQELGLGTTIWSPLASGLLSGKYNNGIPTDSRAALPSYPWIRRRFESPEGQQQIEKVKRLYSVASDLGLSLPRLAIAWCLKNPFVSTVITGASNPDQVTENMLAVDDVSALTLEAMQKIDDILDNVPSPAHNFR